MCSRPLASLLPGLRKAGRGPGNEATHPLDSWMATQVSEIWCQITRTLLRRLDEVSQLLNEVGHLLCEAGQLLYEVGHQIVADNHHGVWQAEVQE